ncbi:MAG: Glycosyl transferase group 1 [Candidatus Moranbacteria bacterium GW2011_GWF2_35_39]|nr:MAG: Glycosyl transferase group 1 [Candidatus Moranbacteria bacterium GW2011_GWF2_35_39]
MRFLEGKRLDMKLLYIANKRIPTEKAHGIQIVKMCEAFANIGLAVNLLVPTRNNFIKEDVFTYYNVRNNFKVGRFYSPDFYWPGWLDRISFAVKQLISSLIILRLATRNKHDFIYSRDELSILLLSLFNKNIFFEAHKFSDKQSFFYKRFKKSGVKIVVISRGLRDKFIKFGFKYNNILFAPDGVAVEDFDLTIPKQEARKKVALPADKRMIMYAGQLFSWKGADIIARAAEILKNDLFVFVGGLGQDLIDFRYKFSDVDNILIVGHRPHKDIPVYLKSADVLVLANSSKEDISKFYTSPLKMFEYMASGTPIVASRLPSIMEVLNDENSLLVRSDSPVDLADGIRELLNDNDRAIKISQKALKDVAKFSWNSRARAILNFISNN